MITLQVIFESLPAGSQGVLLDYRPKGIYGQSTQPWRSLGLHTAQTTRILVDGEPGGLIDLRARVIGKAGTLLPGETIETYGPIGATTVSDRPSMSSMTYPPAIIAYKPLDGTIEITPKAPEGQDPKEYVYEVRQSASGVDPIDAQVVGDVEVGSTRAFFSAPTVGIQEVHYRAIRTEDGSLGPWVTESLQTPSAAPQEMVSVDDDDALFTDVTPTDYGFGPSMEVVAGDLQFAQVSSIWGMTGGEFPSIWGITGEENPPIWGVFDFYPWGEFTADTIDQGAVHDFVPALHPEVSDLDHTGQGRSIWGDMAGRIVFNPQGNPHRDELWSSRGFSIWDTGDRQGDHFGLEVEQKIALSQDTGAPTDYSLAIPGHRYRSRQYATKCKVYNRFSRRQIVFSRWRRRRLLRNRKWEFTVPFDYPSEDGLIEFSFATVETLEIPTVAVAVQSIAGDGVSYSYQIEDLTKTSIKVRVTMHQRGEVTTSSGAGTWSYPASFHAAPEVEVSAIDASVDTIAGLSGTPGTSSAGVYTVDTAGNNVDKTVSCTAVGIPPTSDHSLHLVIAGY